MCRHPSRAIFRPRARPNIINGSVGVVRARSNGGAAELRIDWDVSRGTLRVPFKFESGAMRSTLRAEFAAPRKEGDQWNFAVGGGWILIDRLTPHDQQLVLRRVAVRGQVDLDRERVAIEQGDIGTREFGDPHASGREPRGLRIL